MKVILKVNDVRPLAPLSRDFVFLLSITFAQLALVADDAGV
jgi:hypothetical protein